MMYNYVSLGPEPTLLTSKFHLLPLGLCLLFLITDASNVAAPADREDQSFFMTGSLSKS
jgi:hypothetical protein